MARKVLAAAMTVMLTHAGCYNTYSISLEELAKLQEGGSSNAVQVKTAEGQDVVVSEDTRIGVTLKGGEYVPVSAFNFTLAGNQLVAPDEDRLLSASEIETGNVKEVSGLKTGLLVAGSAAALVAAGVLIALTAPERKAYGE